MGDMTTDHEAVLRGDRARMLMRVQDYEHADDPVSLSIVKHARASIAAIDYALNILAKLPKTADGVPVIPGTNTPLWNPDYKGTCYFHMDASFLRFDADTGNNWLVEWDGTDPGESLASEWYSTRELAEQAAEGGGG